MTDPKLASGDALNLYSETCIGCGRVHGWYDSPLDIDMAARVYLCHVCRDNAHTIIAGFNERIRELEAELKIANTRVEKLEAEHTLIRRYLV